MLQLLRTNSDNKDFVYLVKLLDENLAKRDGDEHAFYHQFNKIANLKNVVLVYIDTIVTGCGAFKPYNEKIVEIKRMFVLPGARRKGIAAKILIELESWAAALHFNGCILETGLKQPEAIQLYEKSGYKKIENYGQYADVKNSVCMKKEIQPQIL